MAFISIASPLLPGICVCVCVRAFYFLLHTQCVSIVLSVVRVYAGSPTRRARALARDLVTVHVATIDCVNRINENSMNVLYFKNSNERKKI